MWAVPSSTAFWSWLGEILSSPKVFRCFTRSLSIAHRAPITTGTTVAFFSQSLSTLTFWSWYLVIFSTSFWLILLSPRIATSINHTCFFSTTVVSGMFWTRSMFVCLKFKVPENFDFFILQHFLDIVFPPFFGCR